MFDYVVDGNMTIFDFMYPTFKIDKPIRLIELFGGVGSQAMALRNIGADFEHYRLVEYDKYPVMSYNAIHGTNFEPTDIRNVHGNDLGIVDTDQYCYIMTYSFPCQDLSVAGKMAGMSKGSGTRSGLLWEVERLLSEVDNLPQVLLMENVPQVISDANIEDFRLWQDFLESKGYTNYVVVVNAKNQGVAQNRERAFMISLLGQWNYKFPQSIPLTKTMADYLEDKADEKYYISQDRIQKILNSSFSQERDIIQNGIICGTILARDYKDPKCITIKQATTEGYIECKLGGVADLSYPTSKTRRGRVQDNGDVCPTLTATETGVCRIETPYRIRKLTPLECWRLMGFSDEDFHKAEKVNSNTQLYKQAGNSIVVLVLEAIFKQLL